MVVFFFIEYSMTIKKIVICNTNLARLSSQYFYNHDVLRNKIIMLFFPQFTKMLNTILNDKVYCNILIYLHFKFRAAPHIVSTAMCGTALIPT